MRQKTVLITGASRGIGKACALLFSKAGYFVFLNCSTSKTEIETVKAEIEASGGSCEIQMGNVGNPQDVTKIFSHIQKASGGLDVLINNAGICHIGLLSDMSDDEWTSIMQTNLSSVFYCSRAATPHMVSQKAGKIINISSMWGTTGASCEAAYSASKAGVNGLTRALAKELAPCNIQVNSIACGAIDTSMNRQMSREERSQLEEDIPSGRFGTPEEVALLALDLAQKHSYLTGQIIGLDGGYI